MQEAVVLSATPEARMKETTFVTFMSAHKGQTPETKLVSSSVAGKRVVVELAREGRTRHVELDLAAGKVKVR